ncbi:glycosyltransferase family 4 protein [Patescibacteria group bacterium]|nr:glycosyltransferase family 4 protein [Patescibacteria group bacterium]
MKIGVITQICNTKSGSRAPIELAIALAKKNSVCFYATDQNYDPKAHQQLTTSSVNVRLIKTETTPLIGKWLAGLKVRKLIRQDQPHILSAHCMLSLLIGTTLARLPIVSTYYGTQLNAYLERLPPYQKPNIKDKLLNWLGNQIILLIQKVHFKLSDQIVAISQYTSQEAQTLYNRTIPYIYLGAKPLTNTSRSTPNLSPPTTYYLPPTTILSVSRFTPYKGFHHLIETFNKLAVIYPEIKLTIAGSLGSQKYLDYLKEIANDKVSFIINCDDEKLAQLYQASDIYATCDKYLFFGLPILEAASFSKPSVALNFCAANEVIEHGKTGFMANNLNELESYLERLIQKPTVRRNLGANARKRAKEMFTWGKTAGEYETLFNQFLENSQMRKYNNIR